MTKTSKTYVVVAGFVALTLSAALLVAQPGPLLGSGATTVSVANPPSPTTSVAASPSAFDAAEELSKAFSGVAEAVMPSVVSVRAVRNVRVEPAFGANPFFELPLREFFRDDPRLPFAGPVPDRELRREGQGTGVVVSADGYVLTNHHVVRDASEVTVEFNDKSYDARLIGSDPKTDLAVLEIDVEGIRPAPMGDSDAIRIGEWVIAVGDPFGLSSSITAGIVSAKGRSRVGLADYEDFIQTDAAINPGNSGGPLVNLRGEVIGINTAILSASGGNAGIGFAIPINMARAVMESLVADGRVARGWLGVTIQDLDDGLAASFGYETTAGALIGEVVEGGPAAAAGLLPGDIITGFDGEPVEDIDDLRLRVAATDPGTIVEVEVFRDGTVERFEFETGELTGDEPVVGAGLEASRQSLGVTVRTLTPDLGRELGHDDVRGVVITNVDPTSPAARAGLRAREVITSVQGESVSSVADFHAALDRHELAEGVRLTVLGPQGRRIVFLRTQS